ncbi:MAG: V-type ATPase subunit [Treponema sp.]|jgi:hypothetical protein|nr:V-type ATPase subunit [Treponema sp.]
MIGAGERAYAYAKACGIIGKSFVGRRIAPLRHAGRLSELDRLIFGSQARDLPERELLPNLEKRLIQRSVDSILSVVNSYRPPPAFLIALIRVYEYADLKTALALTGGTGPDASKPAFTPLVQNLKSWASRWGTVHFDAWPDPRKMLAGTEFEFLLDSAGKLRAEFDGVSLETALDRHYYQKLWEAARGLKKSDRLAAEKITAEEISLRNCAWTLRLRTYYGMEGEEVKRRLIALDDYPRLRQDALAALEFPLDDRTPWEKWRRAGFLNLEGAARFEGGWRADPRYFQNACSRYLYKLALRLFRRRPSSLDACFCFIKLKQFEEDLLISDAEGLSMGMSGADVFNVLERDA